MWLKVRIIDDIELLILLEKRLLNKKLLNRKRGISFSPKFCNLSITALKSSVSNAEDKSSSISCWGLLLSSEVYMSSKSESRVVSVLCHRRKQFYLMSSKLYLDKYEISCLLTIFSNMLARRGSLEIGL